MPFGMINERDPLGFTFRYRGESLILGGEVQLSLHKIGILSCRHGFSPEKCWPVAVNTETASQN
jgi:hypothetical protein